MPEQIVVERGAHPNQPFAVIDQQPDVELDAGQLGHRQPVNAFPERSAGDGHRVDAVGLAAVATTAALAGHQPRRDPDHALAMNEQEPLEGTGNVPAVLQRPHPLVLQAARPVQRRREASITNRDRLVAQQLAADGGDRGDRVRALVHVRTEHDHGLRPFHSRSESGRPADIACWGRCHAPIKSRRTSPTGDERHSESQSGPTADSVKASQLAAGRSLPSRPDVTAPIQTASVKATAPELSSKPRAPGSAPHGRVAAHLTASVQFAPLARAYGHQSCRSGRDGLAGVYDAGRHKRTPRSRHR